MLPGPRLSESISGASRGGSGSSGPSGQIARIIRARQFQAALRRAPRIAVDQTGGDARPEVVGPEKFDERLLVLGEATGTAHQTRKTPIRVIFETLQAPRNFPIVLTASLTIIRVAPGTKLHGSP